MVKWFCVEKKSKNRQKDNIVETLFTKIIPYWITTSVVAICRNLWRLLWISQLYPNRGEIENKGIPQQWFFQCGLLSVISFIVASPFKFGKKVIRQKSAAATQHCNGRVVRRRPKSATNDATEAPKYSFTGSTIRNLSAIFNDNHLFVRWKFLAIAAKTCFIFLGPCVSNISQLLCTCFPP